MAAALQNVFEIASGVAVVAARLVYMLGPRQFARRGHRNKNFSAFTCRSAAKRRVGSLAVQRNADLCGILIELSSVTGFSEVNLKSNEIRNFESRRWPLFCPLMKCDILRPDNKCYMPNSYVSSDVLFRLDRTKFQMFFLSLCYVSFA